MKTQRSTSTTSSVTLVTVTIVTQESSPSHTTERTTWRYVTWGDGPKSSRTSWGTRRFCARLTELEPMSKVIMRLKLWNTQGTQATNPIQRWLQRWIQVSPLIRLYLRLDFLKFFWVFWHFFTTMFHVDTMSTIASCEFTFTAYVHLLQ